MQEQEFKIVSKAEAIAIAKKILFRELLLRIS
jgi:hypothetical protein